MAGHALLVAKRGGVLAGSLIVAWDGYSRKTGLPVSRRPSPRAGGRARRITASRKYTATTTEALPVSTRSKPLPSTNEWIAIPGSNDPVRS